MTRLAAALALALLLAGCAPPPKPEPALTLPPVASDPPPVPKPRPAPPAPVPETRPALNVDILVSADLPAYLAVAERLRQDIYGDARIHFMKGDPRTAGILLPHINQSGGDQVVGIGLLAARAARSLPSRQAVFCQVFDYGDADLLGDSRKGISLVPGPAFQLSTWKTLQPELRHVGVLIGPQQEPLLAAAGAAAESLGLALHVRRVDSDKGMLVALREMAPSIDGLWLLPDNRILSTATLRALMGYSLKTGITVAGFNHQLLGHGALLTMTARHDEVARAVIERLEAGKGKAVIPGPNVVFLETGEIRVNERIVRRLGLTMPQELKANSHAP